DGWLTGSGRGRTTGPPRPTSGIDQLRLIPDGVVRYAGMQAGLWGEIGPADERAHRALVRVQGLLGPDSVFTAVLGGGRGYADRVTLVPWGDERSPHWPGGDERSPHWPGGDERSPHWPGGDERSPHWPGGDERSPGTPPWPGRLPAPAPATVLPEPAPLLVCTAEGEALMVDERL